MFELGIIISKKWIYKNIKLDLMLIILGTFLKILNIDRLILMTTIFKSP